MQDRLIGRFRSSANTSRTPPACARIGLDHADAGVPPSAATDVDLPCRAVDDTVGGVKAFSVTTVAGPPGSIVLRLAGELDLASVAELCRAGADALKQHDCRQLVLDVAAVTFLDAAGLGVLVGLRTHAQRTGRRVALRGVPPRVARALKLTGQDARFPTE